MLNPQKTSVIRLGDFKHLEDLRNEKSYFIVTHPFLQAYAYVCYGHIIHP